MTTTAVNGNETSVTIAEQQTKNWKNLPKYYLDNDTVKEYSYHVIETDVLFDNTQIANYKTYYDVTGEGPGENGLVTIDNSPVSISINVTKEWTRSNEPVTNRESISYALYRTDSQTAVTVNPYQLAVDKGSKEVGKINYVSGKDSGWQTVTISNLPMYERVITTEGETTTVSYNPISYYVVETGAAADAGYVLTAEYSKDGGTSPDSDPSSVAVDSGTITIINTETPGVELPSTGGPGTVLYTAAGLSLILGASLWLMLRRRKEQQN